MAGRAPLKKQDFSQVLEMGAKVDDIFKDSPAPLGSNPFGLDVSQQPASQDDGSELQLDSGPNSDSLVSATRKLAALEAMFKLVAREYYSFGQLVSEILRIAMEQIRCESGSFLEVDHENHNLFFRAVAGRSSENLLSFTIPVGKGVVGFVCETQQPMALSNVDESGMYLRSISDAVGFETKNMLAYPVVVRGISFGCIELLNRLGESQFTDADKEVMAAIAEYAGKVIENRLVLAALSKEVAALKAGKSGEEAA